MARDAPDMFARTVGACGRERRDTEMSTVTRAQHPHSTLGRVKRHGMETGRTKLAETSVVVWALDPPLLRVRVETLVASGTVIVFGVPPALGHAAQVVLVQELTCVALLT